MIYLTLNISQGPVTLVRKKINTIFCKRHFSSDGIYREHVAGRDARYLVQETEAEVRVGGVTVISVQRLHLHERNSCENDAHITIIISHVCINSPKSETSGLASTHCYLPIIRTVRILFTYLER